MPSTSSGATTRPTTPVVRPVAGDVGHPVRAGGLEVTVRRFWFADCNDGAPPGYTLLELRATVRDISVPGAWYGPLSWSAQDSAGRTFAAAIVPACTPPAYADPTLEPGTSVRVQMEFAVPGDSAGLQVVFDAPPPVVIRLTGSQ